MSENIIDDGGNAFPLTIAFNNNGDCLCAMPEDRGMTLRQYAAIHLKVANSGTDWLDEMIEKSNNDDFAAKAMQAILSNNELISDTDNLSVNWITRNSFKIADAMLKARG